MNSVSTSYHNKNQHIGAIHPTNVGSVVGKKLQYLDSEMKSYEKPKGIVLGEQSNDHVTLQIK
jgi:hypothetical protein